MMIVSYTFWYVSLDIYIFINVFNVLIIKKFKNIA